MEDVGGEKLFVTEELPETGLSIKKSFAAKTSVEDAERLVDFLVFCDQ